MRALYTILAILLFTAATAFLPQDTEQIEDCAAKAGPNATYLKDFVVSLPAAEPGQRPPMYRQAVVLRGDNIYRFNLCNSQGEAVLRIYDSSTLILSSFDPASGEEYNPIQFLCRKTGPYNIIITFRDGKAGEAIGIMSHVDMDEARKGK